MNQVCDEIGVHVLHDDDVQQTANSSLTSEFGVTADNTASTGNSQSQTAATITDDDDCMIIDIDGINDKVRL